jgi:hypothetical protein
MNHKDFDKIVEIRCKKIVTVLSSKAKEYASGADRLHNFKIAAAAKGETPEKALWGMYMKHWVSIQDMVNDPDTINPKVMDEKIGDAVNYHILLEALFIDRLRMKSG